MKEKLQSSSKKNDIHYTRRYEVQYLLHFHKSSFYTARRECEVLFDGCVQLSISVFFYFICKVSLRHVSSSPVETRRGQKKMSCCAYNNKHPLKQ